MAQGAWRDFHALWLVEGIGKLGSSISNSALRLTAGKVEQQVHYVYPSKMSQNGRVWWIRKVQVFLEQSLLYCQSEWGHCCVLLDRLQTSRTSKPNCQSTIRKESTKPSEIWSFALFRTRHKCDTFYLTLSPQLSDRCTSVYLLGSQTWQSIVPIDSPFTSMISSLKQPFIGDGGISPWLPLITRR